MSGYSSDVGEEVLRCDLKTIFLAEVREQFGRNIGSAGIAIVPKWKYPSPTSVVMIEIRNEGCICKSRSH
jgi:hypothetical protein